MLNTNLFNHTETYYFSPELRDAVRIAEQLGMPLLLTGEPGTGKTKIADALQGIFQKSWNIPVVKRVFNTKSISVFKDLLYQYNYLKHFQDVQLKREVEADNFENQYIKYGALGAAIKDNKNRSIVLIDEIDKAPRDFPNDLLDILAETAFEVPELEKTDKNKFRTVHQPFIVITSNSEKSLPDAFLRRCIYYHIHFPTDAVLEKILLKHFAKNSNTVQQISNIETWFNDIRKSLYRKKPGTAELISWLQIMEQQKFPFASLKYGDMSSLNSSQKEILKMSFSVLAKTQEDFDKLHLEHQDQEHV